MHTERRRTFANRRRTAIIAILATLAIVGGIRFALPASAEAYICTDGPWGGACIEGVHVSNGTTFEGIIVDLVEDNIGVELEIFVYNSDGFLTHIHDDYGLAHKPERRYVDVNDSTPLRVHAMRLNVCQVNLDTGDRVGCEESDIQEL